MLSDSTSNYLKLGPDLFPARNYQEAAEPAPNTNCPHTCHAQKRSALWKAECWPWRGDTDKEMEVIEEQEPGGAIRVAEATRMHATNPNQGRWPLTPLPPAWSNKKQAPFFLPQPCPPPGGV